MRKLLFAIVFVLCTSPVFASFESKGVGKDRETLTADEIEARALTLQRASDFYLLRFSDDAKSAPGRILNPRIYDIIKRAAAANNLDPEILASVIFIESYGKPDAKSPTGPRGICQFTQASAKELGLKIKLHVKVGTHTEWVEKTKGRGKNKTTVRVEKTVTDYKDIDERLDPEIAIPAMAKRIAIRAAWLGGHLDLAISEYHMGAGRIMEVLSAYYGRKLKTPEIPALLRNDQFTYASLFFRTTPFFRRRVYEVLKKIDEKADFSSTYYFHVVEAGRLLRLYRESPSTYNELVDSFAGRFGRKVLPNWQWAFVTELEAAGLTIRDLTHLKELEESKLIVKAPLGLERFGVRLRLTGSSPIGQADLPNQEYYAAAEPGTLGLLMYVGTELQRLCPKCRILETNSLVRDLDYQLLGLVKKIANQNAVTELPMHVFGWAFDLPRPGLDRATLEALEFLLTDMRYAGLLSYIKEGEQKTFHVVAHPTFRQEFAEYFRKHQALLVASSSQ